MIRGKERENENKKLPNQTDPSLPRHAIRSLLPTSHDFFPLKMRNSLHVFRQWSFLFSPSRQVLPKIRTCTLSLSSKSVPGAVLERVGTARSVASRGGEFTQQGHGLQSADPATCTGRPSAADGPDEALVGHTHRPVPREPRLESVVDVL